MNKEYISPVIKLYITDIDSDFLKNSPDIPLSPLDTDWELPEMEGEDI